MHSSWYADEEGILVHADGADQNIAVLWDGGQMTAGTIRDIARRLAEWDDQPEDEQPDVLAVATTHPVQEGFTLDVQFRSHVAHPAEGPAVVAIAVVDGPWAMRPKVVAHARWILGPDKHVEHFKGDAGAELDDWVERGCPC